MWIKNVRCLVLFTASGLILLLVVLNLIRKQNRFTIFDYSSCENIPHSDNPTQGEIRSRAPFTDRSQQVSNKAKNRFADFNSQQFILSQFFSLIIPKKSTGVTVDCIDWNSVVDLSKHPLGPPTSPEDQDQINVVKETGHIY